MKLSQVVIHSLASVPSHTPFYDVPIYNSLGFQHYNINISLGTPPQSFSLLLDTGSADVWVPKPNSSGCAPTCPRGFNIENSSSIIATNITFDARYGLTPDPETAVLGQYYNDTISVSGLPAIPNAMFAVGDVPKRIFDAYTWGIFGLGPRSQEAISLTPSTLLQGLANRTYTPLWERLSLASRSGTRKFGIWLNAQNAIKGSIRFGGGDGTKFTGQLMQVPLIIEADTGLPRSWEVNLASVSRLRVVGRGAAKKTLLTAKNFSMPCTIDTGSPNIYLPTALYNEIINGLGGQYFISQQLSFPCSLRAQSTGYLYFGFPTKDKSISLEIRVPFNDVIYPFGYPYNLPMFWDGDLKEMCYMAILPTDGFIKLLGASFIRSAYLVFDLDNLVIKMAQSRWQL